MQLQVAVIKTNTNYIPDAVVVISRRRNTRNYEFVLGNVSQIHINHLTNIFLCHRLKKLYYIGLDIKFSLIGINDVKVKHKYNLGQY